MAVSYDRMSGPRAPVQKMGGSSSLADVLNVILDKGIVIDAWVRLSVIGIEILTLEARVVVASVETYLRYAEAIGLTQLASAPPAQTSSGGGQQSQQNGDQNGHEELSEDQVIGYLEDHPDGVRLGELQSYFNAPRNEVQEVVNELVDENKARRDDQKRVYFPSDNQK
jgi:gas vesicle structural protein